MERMGVVKYEAIEIELDGAPGVRTEQIDEVVGQLLFGQLIELIIEILTDAADGAGIGLYRLGLETLALEMGLIIALEICYAGCCHGRVTS